MTRGDSEIFLIGQPQDSLDIGGKLPVSKKILQYLKYLQSCPGDKTRPVKTLICCPLQTKTNTAVCRTGATGCATLSGNKCVVAAVTGYWRKAGIPTVTDVVITKYIIKLHEEWKVLCKNKNKSSVADIAKRNCFQQKLEGLFDIACPDAIKILEFDRLRTPGARHADIEFYLDQKGARKGIMTSLDKAHQDTVEKKRKRLEVEEMRKQISQADSRAEAAADSIPVPELGNIEDNNNTTDPDFTAPQDKKEKKKDFVELLVPRKIAQSVALNNKRWKISDNATASSLALIIQESGGNLDDFAVSKSTCRREGISAVTKDTEKIKEIFKNSLSARDLTIHFDGKAVKEYSAGCHLEKERIAVIVSSPSLDSPQVLGVPPAEGSKGVDQLAVLASLIEEWGIKDHIMAIGFDTTASNTGINSGAVTLVEKLIGEACMWSACQRHIHELHIKHAAESVFGPTSGPSDLLFKKLRSIWPDLKDKIDYTGLNKFDWEGYGGTVVKEEATKTLTFCSKELDNTTFPREDYRELLELILVWLGGANMVSNFKFQWPGAYHHARFMAKSLYILKMDMLDKQFNFLSKNQKEQVSRLALFVGVYFGVWFLQCSVVSTAPLRTLNSFEQMINFSEFDNHLAFTVMDSMRRHTWYLTEQWVVVSLADTDCSDKERKAVASALSNTPRPDKFTPGKPNLPVEFWPESGIKPGLDTFVGQQSWLLPSLLNLTSENMEWLDLDVHQWQLMSGFRKFSNFVRKLLVVNDPAERGVKLIQDFVSTSTDESLRQARMISAIDQRKKYPTNMTKMEMRKLKKE